MNVHIFYYFSIYWSDTSLALYMTIKLNQLAVMCTTRDEHFTKRPRKNGGTDSHNDYSADPRAVQDYSTYPRFVQLIDLLHLNYH